MPNWIIAFRLCADKNLTPDHPPHPQPPHIECSLSTSYFHAHSTCNSTCSLPTPVLALSEQNIHLDRHTL